MAKECVDLTLKYPLNDGNFIPVLGLGVSTFTRSKDDVEETSRSVSIALKQGYPMIDTAEFYK
jgi:diketogulonate reductase-like aldo/keto reductase